MLDTLVVAYTVALVVHTQITFLLSLAPWPCRTDILLCVLLLGMLLSAFQLFVITNSS